MAVADCFSFFPKKYVAANVLRRRGVVAMAMLLSIARLPKVSIVMRLQYVAVDHVEEHVAYLRSPLVKAR